MIISIIVHTRLRTILIATLKQKCVNNGAIAEFDSKKDNFENIEMDNETWDHNKTVSIEVANAARDIASYIL